MNICNQFGSMGECTKSSTWSLGSVEVVRGLGYQLEKSGEGVTAVFTGFELDVMDHKIWVVKEKFNTSCWPTYIKTCNRIMTLLAGWPVGKNEETYIHGLDANNIKTAQQPNRCGQSQSSEAWYWSSFHYEWSDIGLTVHCSSLILGRRDVLSYRGPHFHFPGECLVKWTWDSLVVYMHFEVAILICQSGCILLTAVPCMGEM